jgi:hypothetical protein
MIGYPKNTIYMNCKQCNKPIYTMIVLSCSCGVPFCSPKCLNEYHKKRKVKC